MEELYDYRDWCRMCGSIEGNSHITKNLLEFISEAVKIPSRNIRACIECKTNLDSIIQFISKARSLTRMFNGLQEENEQDLSMKRLNAYRAHFDLPEMVLEDVTIDREPDEIQMELVDFQTNDNDVQSEILEEHIESPVAHEEYELEEETYLEEVEEEVLDDSYYLDDHQDYENMPKTPNNKSQANEKTEDEKMFNFQCHICQHSEFLKMKILSAHCRTEHNCLPRVKCCSDKCDSVLSTWRRLMIHKEEHFPNHERLRCPECNKVYSTTAFLDKHMESHKFCYVCTHCGKNFKEQKTLRLHEATHLKPLEERRNILCPYEDCGIKFISKQTCQNHIAMKHQRVISCYCNENECGKSFFTKKALNEHLRNTHTDRKHLCDQCNFKAKTKSALNVHKDIHKKGEDFVCDLCNASFAVYRRLKTHMICHSDLTPFQCHYCDSAFKRSKDLRSHLIVHTKERPFSCQFCTKSFANAGNCRKHKLKDHLEEVQAWEAEHGVGGRKKLKCYE